MSRLAIVVVMSFLLVGFAPPISGGRVTSPVTFRSGGGWVRSDCTRVSRANHRGTDYGVAIGTPVRAAAAGTVIRSVDGCSNRGSMSSRCGGGFGNHVIIQHEDGYATLYAHLTPGTPVARGARVGCGDVIGSSGNSGRSTGPHLHFEVRSGVTSEASYFGSGRTVDLGGGACGSQSASLWSGGSCAPAGPRDDARVVRATHSGEVRGTGGMRLTQVFTVRNTGTTAWAPGEVAMVHTSGAFREVGQVDLPSAVEPGAQVELRVPVTVPGAAGLHRGQWRMARLGGAIFGGTGTLAVRVAGAPRACSSATLGREVPDGTCVQVSYPGCGMRTCAWYGCADGAWTCIDGATCPGEAHENASCEPPAETPPADGGTPEMCKPENRDCEADAECCDGLACIVGACRAISECRMQQEACGAASECCYPLQCRPSAIDGPTACCVSGGNQCETDGDCCGEMACVAGRCAHRREGESCAHILDCEGALLCRDGTCGF